METSSSEEFCALFDDSSKTCQLCASAITQWATVTGGSISRNTEDDEIVYRVSYNLAAVRRQFKFQTMPKQLTSYERYFKKMTPYVGKVIQSSHGGHIYKIWEFRKCVSTPSKKRSRATIEKPKVVEPVFEPIKLAKFAFTDEVPWQLSFEISWPTEDRSQIPDADWLQ